VRIHELIHGGDFDGDGRLDFLVNDDPDLRDLPDRIYLADSQQFSVSEGSGIAEIISQDINHVTVRLSATTGNGWAYIDVASPVDQNFHIGSVTRSDGSTLAEGQYWFTDRTFTNLVVRPIYEDRIHLIDDQPNTVYSVNFERTIPLGEGTSGDDVLVGGDGDDCMVGNAGNDELRGIDGNDTLYGDSTDSSSTVTGNDTLNGGDGNDSMLGGPGDDTIDGGAVSDTAVYSGAWVDYNISGTGPFTITDTRGGSPDGTDTVSNVENFQFSNGTFTAADIPNDAPTDIALSSTSVDENAANGTIVGSLLRSDADIPLGDTAAYSLFDDAGGRFAISGTDLVVADGPQLDCEAATSRAVTVRVTDAHGAFFDETFAIDLNDLNDNAPVFDSGASASAAENVSTATVVYDADAHDDDGTAPNNTIAYSLTGDDAGDFSVDPSTGEVKFLLSPDYEAPADSNADNVYDIVVHANDGVHDVTQAVAITVTDLAEGITGTAGNDTLIGTSSSDSISGLGGNDSLVGNAGNDTLDGGTGADRLAGGLNNDTYVVDNPADMVVESAGAGTDSVLTSLGTYTLTSNVENLTFTGPGGFAGAGNTTGNIITGGASGDSLSGLNGNDTLIGNDGSDTVGGGSGNDSLDGGNGNDMLDTGAGNDNALGGVGNDSLLGNAGKDTLIGGDGNDTLDGGAAADQLIGGLGDDTYIVAQATDTATESLGEGMDTVEALLSGYTLASNFENLIYIGGAKFKGTGNTLDNSITGGNGNDTLTGGAGADTVAGGIGADRFAFGPGDLAAGPALDTIADFNHAEGDKIDLKLIDANSNTTPANESFVFIGANAFTHATRQLHYMVNGSGGVNVEGDTDGDGVADFTLVVDGVTSLAVTDFVL
jgi:Ca2+-binding RTX toxin-like protein